MISVIICAAGKGERAARGKNKLLCELNGMPVLCYSLSAFSEIADEMLITCREEDERSIKALLSPYPHASTVRGGDTRAMGVYRALQAAKGDIVLVHDGARPFVTRKIIETCLTSIKMYGSGVCAVPATDTTVLCEDETVYAQPPRKDVYCVQTPQGFYTQKLLRAYEEAFSEERLHEFTDDSGIYGEFVEAPRICPGERSNRKLTYAEDFMPAERVGFGVDTHAFDIPADYALGIMRLNMNYIHLCGVTIPSQFSLKAHSDGDAAVHALMDALLSAIGERDIGYHFPDTDPAYEGADSMQMLARVMDMVRGKSLAVGNVSISVLAESPRLSPYIEQMRKCIGEALDCPHVAIAAGTNEKLGYVGEGKGITAFATVLLR